MVMKIDMNFFPKFYHHIKNDRYNSWEESLWANGFKSAQQETGSSYVELNEKDYTWFILKWS